MPLRVLASGLLGDRADRPFGDYVGIPIARFAEARNDRGMDVLLGVVLLVLGLICWGGQSFNWLAPETAVRLGLTEAETAVEPVFWVDTRAEAAWDSLTVWPLPVAGLLLLLDVSAWAHLGLVGGGIYLYFSGRGVFQRLAMQRRGMRIGSDASVRVGIVFLLLWGGAALVAIAAAASDLSTS